MQKIVYTFDALTRAYNGELTLGEGDLSPVDLAAGEIVWLVPGGCLEVPPPACAPGQWAVARDGAWTVEPMPAPTIEPGAEPEPEPLTPAELIAQARADLKDRVTAHRWEIETGGVFLPNGLMVKTSKDDQDRITSTIAGMEGAGMTSVDFKAAGGWVTLTLADLRGIRTAIAWHVQACFSAERAHHEAIDLLDVDELEDYDVTQSWPGGAA